MTRTTITVNLSEHPASCPLGLLLAPLIAGTAPLQSNHTILIGWNRPYNKLGLIQKSGQVRIGDRLVEINEVSVRQWSFEKIIRVLRCFDDGIKIRSLGFEVLKDESGAGFEDKNFRMATRKRLYCLNTFVKAYNILSEENVVKYEFKCHLFIRDDRGNDEEITWSVWKRYSEIKELHDKLMDGFEWKMRSIEGGKGISFPSKHGLEFLLHGHFNSSMIEKRRTSLEAYWARLQSCNDLFNFGDPLSHRFSKDVADFLDIEQFLHGEGSGSIFSPSRGDRHSLNFDVSMISKTASSGNQVSALKLDDSGASGLGEILVKNLHSNSLRPCCSTGKIPTRDRRKTNATKPAFQRNLFDDF